jgi:2-octaprenyl-6-methoxyphenol hydroxylase
MTKNSKIDDLSFDVLIVGGGLAGATLALMLGQKGIRTAVIERFPLSLQRQRSFDHRTTALAAGTIRILRSIGVWEHVAPDILSYYPYRNSGWASSFV